jgi:hypothetical protein
MGTGVITIRDSTAAFAQECPRKPTGRHELHLVLSPDGCTELIQALLAAGDRQRKTRIVVACVRPLKKTGYEFFRQLSIEVPELGSESDLLFAADQFGATLILPRNWLRTAVEMCEAMQMRADDIAIKFGDGIAIWIWGSGLGP